jgi:hypothetical protein
MGPFRTLNGPLLLRVRDEPRQMSLNGSGHGSGGNNVGQRLGNRNIDYGRFPSRRSFLLVPLVKRVQILLSVIPGAFQIIFQQPLRKYSARLACTRFG